MGKVNRLLVLIDVVSFGRGSSVKVWKVCHLILKKHADRGGENNFD